MSREMKGFNDGELGGRRPLAGFSSEIYECEGLAAWCWCVIGPGDVELAFGFGFDSEASANADFLGQVFDVEQMYETWRVRKLWRQVENERGEGIVSVAKVLSPLSPASNDGARAGAQSGARSRRERGARKMSRNDLDTVQPSSGAVGDVSRVASGDGSTWAALANLFWWYRNKRFGQHWEERALFERIRREQARLRSAGISASAVWRVSRCLKVRRARFNCDCPMCQHIRCKSFE